MSFDIWKNTFHIPRSLKLLLISVSTMPGCILLTVTFVFRRRLFKQYICIIWKRMKKKSYHTHIQQDLPLYIAWSKKCFVLNVYICQKKRHFINATYKIDMNKNICGTVSRNTTILLDIILNSHSTEVYERFPLCVVFPGLSLNRN